MVIVFFKSVNCADFLYQPYKGHGALRSLDRITHRGCVLLSDPKLILELAMSKIRFDIFCLLSCLSHVIKDSLKRGQSYQAKTHKEDIDMV